jgi:hypothetical protein
LFVADLLHPIHGLAVALFLDGDVRDGRSRRGAMPMLFARWEPDHVTRPDFLDRSPRALRPAATGGDDNGLTQRVGVENAERGAWNPPFITSTGSWCPPSPKRLLCWYKGRWKRNLPCRAFRDAKIGAFYFFSPFFGDGFSESFFSGVSS